jgi:hypothetical protein
MTGPYGGALHGYSAHGYVVASELPLPAMPSADPQAAPDLVLRRGEPRTVPAARPDGHELALLCDDSNRLCYAMSRDGERVMLRFSGVCDFVADPNLRNVTYHADPRADEHLVGVLASGTLLAVRLVLDGRLALHASAVGVRGRAVAFVGASGMGKSTLAALACVGDGVLVTDDVLHVSDLRTSALAWPGAVECRLRGQSSSVVAHFNGGSSVRATADGRTALSPPRPVSAPLPLAACVIPLPSKTSARAEVRRLTTMDALLALSRFPRLLGWRDRVSTAHQFQLLADLVQSVPVLEARVPWGPPFDPGAAEYVVQSALAAAWTASPHSVSGTRAPAT